MDRRVTGQTKADELVPAAGAASHPSWLARLTTWLRSTLFPPLAAQRIRGGEVLAAIGLIAAGAVVSLARTEGPGSLNTTWIEDANNFLQDALHQSVMTTLTTQMNGYYDVLPRIVTAIAVGFFPLSWVPGIMSAAAAVAYALFGLI